MRTLTMQTAMSCQADNFYGDDNARDDGEEHRGLMSRARALKKPIFVFWLLPILIFLALAAAALVEGLYSWL